MISAVEALKRLKEGNGRFTSGMRAVDPQTTQQKRKELVGGQAPFAIILGCADSRVPVELVFDQDLGDLFVIRVAGNVINPSILGSIEFAALNLGTRLIVVLGHTNCGAVSATLSEVQNPSGNLSANLDDIVQQIRPSIDTLLQTDLQHDHDALLKQAVRDNVRASVAQMRHHSDVLEELIDKAGLLVVGAEYSLETGLVDFFDGMPDAT